MKFWKCSFPFVFALSVALFFAACKKEKVDNTDQAYPIELSLSKPGRNVVLNWTKTNISDFESYLLVRSTDPIEDTPEPVGIFQTIDDFEENTFEDTAFPLSEKVYYKVYAKVGDRFLFSPTVAIEFDVHLLDFQVSRTVFDAESGRFFMFENQFRKIYKYDLESEELVEVLEDQSAFDYIMAVGDAGEGTELFLARNGDFQVKIYDADNFDLKSVFSAGSSISGIEVGQGVFMLSTSDFFTPFRVYDRLTQNLVEGSDLAQGFDYRIKRMPGDDRVIVGASSDDELVVYKFNDNWQITDEMSAFFLASPLLEIEVSPDGKHFIPSLEGQVFDLELNLVGVVSPSSSSSFAQDYLFSADGTKVYAFLFSPGKMVEFSFPELEELRTIDLNYTPVSAFLSKEGKILVVGWAVDGFNVKTYVDVLDL